MAARKKRRKKASKKTSKRRKRVVHHVKSSSGELALLHKIAKKVTRIDHKVNAGRWGRIKAKAPRTKVWY